MKTLLLTALLFLTTSLSFSQSNNIVIRASIVTLSGDTVSGLLLNEDNLSEGIAFQLMGEKSLKKYFPNDLQGFLIPGDKDVFLSKMIKQSNGQTSIKKFLKVIQYGYSSLYKDDSLCYYVGIEDQDVYQLKHLKYIKEQISSQVTSDVFDYKRDDNKYKGILQYIFRDCPRIANKINATGYNSGDLLDLLNVYNKCMGHPQNLRVTFTHNNSLPNPNDSINKADLVEKIEIPSTQTIVIKDKRRVSCELSFNLGYNYSVSNVLPGRSYAADLPSLKSKNIGYGIEIGLTKDQRLFIVTGFKKTSINMGKVFEIRQGWDFYDTLSVNIKMIQIPFSILYVWQGKRISPMAEIGMDLSTLSSTFVTERMRGIVSGIYDRQVASFSGFIGFHAGIGVRKTINSKITLNVKLTDSVLNFTDEINNGRLTLNSLGLQGGLSITL